MPAPQLVSQPRRNSYHGLEAATQSWIAQDVVTLDNTTGLMEIVANNQSPAKILGLAQAAASTVTSTAAVATPIFPQDKIALDTYGTILSAAKDASAFVAGNVYELISVGSGSSRRWYANYDTAHGTGLACLICEGEVQGSLKDLINAQTRYRALFRFIDSFLALHVGAE